MKFKAKTKHLSVLEKASKALPEGKSWSVKGCLMTLRLRKTRITAPAKIPPMMNLFKKTSTKLLSSRIIKAFLMILFAKTNKIATVRWKSLKNLFTLFIIKKWSPLNNLRIKGLSSKKGRKVIRLRSKKINSSFIIAIGKLSPKMQNLRKTLKSAKSSKTNSFNAMRNLRKKDKSEPRAQENLTKSTKIDLSAFSLVKILSKKPLITKIKKIKIENWAVFKSFIF